MNNIEFETGLFFTTNNIIEENTLPFGEYFVMLHCCGKQVNWNSGGVGTEKGYIYEIKIIADNIITAEHISNLVVSSRTIVDGSKFMDLGEIDEVLHYSLNKHLGKESSPCQIVFGSHKSFDPDDEWYYASKIASKAFNKINEENAIYKYQIASEILDVDPIRVEPYIDDCYESPFTYDHLKYSNAIVVIYSVLEELGLEIRTNGENSTINNGKEWNNEVLYNIKARLITKHIDSELKIPWLVRGSMKRTYKNNIDSSKDCDWSDSQQIRDFDISITDAILELSYIRSRKSSHRVGNRVADLTVCDVQNAYSLVRIILLYYFQVHF